MTSPHLESVPCPYCCSIDSDAWGHELGFTAVRCTSCAIIYCNPRPAAELIDHAVRTGVHGSEAGGLVVRSRRDRAKVIRYRNIFQLMFDDVWRSGVPIAWLDVGAGYGEILEAVALLAPNGSSISGLEPMHIKAVSARERGLTIVEGYLRRNHPKVDLISVVDVFSHIPDFALFLEDVRHVLVVGGQIFIETGNLADLQSRQDFPGELGLPDHLVFAGEKHLLGFLDRAGFDVVQIRRVRIDGALNFIKNLVKKIIGRPAGIGIPYTSKYRQLQVRARLRVIV